MPMKNKILVNVYVPKLLETYDVYIPVNERMARVKELLMKAVYDLSDSSFELADEHYLIEALSGSIYPDNTVVRDTNIKNGSKVILF